jgi:hypothetical protein
MNRTLYNWLMMSNISYDSYLNAINSGKISEGDAKRLLISEEVVAEWALIPLIDNSSDLDLVI